MAASAPGPGARWGDGEIPPVRTLGKPSKESASLPPPVAAPGRRLRRGEPFFCRRTVSTLDGNNVGRALRVRWWLLGLGVLVGTLVALAGSLLTPSVYVAHTRLLVSSDPSTGNDAQDTAQLVAYYAQRLVSDELASRIGDRLHLDVAPRNLAEEITATAIPGTTSVQVDVTASSADESRRIASAAGSEMAAFIGEQETPDGAAESRVKVRIAGRVQTPKAPLERPTLRHAVLGAIDGLLVGLALALVTTRNWSSGGFRHRSPLRSMLSFQGPGEVTPIDAKN